MDPIALKINPENPYQAQTITISPNGVTMTLRLELRYLVYTEKWYLSIWNASENVCLLTHVPLVASEDIANDLLGLFQHIGLGSVVCYPVSAQLYGMDPGEKNMNQFEVQWRDSFA